jgi:hypothetical protein
VGLPGTGLFLTQQFPSCRAEPHVLVRILAWMVIAAIGAFSVIVIVAHYH